MLFEKTNEKERAFFRAVMMKKALRSASLTVECAFILPLFFLAAVTLLLFINAVSLQVRADLSLSNTARQLAAAAGEAGSAVNTLSGGGSNSSGGIWIDLAETKEYHFPVSLIPKTTIKVAARARVYPWIGIRSWADTPYAASGDSGEMVYVTDNQEVYHTHADCTHLDLAIIATTLDQVGKLRNADGKKYKPCSGFPAGYNGTVYVTAQGRYYYPSLSYGSLTRHVHLVCKSDLPPLPLCGRCAKKEANHYHEAA